MKALALLGALLAACSHGEARPGPITAAAPTGAGPAEKANPDGGSPGDSATATGASAKERTASGGAQEPRVAGDEIGRGSPPASTSQERGPGKEAAQKPRRAREKRNAGRGTSRRFALTLLSACSAADSFSSPSAHSSNSFSRESRDLLIGTYFKHHDFRQIGSEVLNLFVSLSGAE